MGWFIDTRSFIVKLPDDKYLAYSKQVKEILKAGRVEDKNLQNIIGRLQSSSYVVPHSKYFLNRLRSLQRVTTRTKYANIPISTKVDLELWLKFLSHAYTGTNIKNLVYRKPTQFCWADSCPFGLGGYSSSGNAWRFYIPPSLRSEHTNNVLEFMAIIVTIWLDTIKGTATPLLCYLACSDSISTVGWLHRTNFQSATQPIHEDCARKIANIMMNNKSTLYSQHQTGKHNCIADILSRWFFLNDIELTTFLLHRYQNQMPTNFHISPLPNELSSWIISCLRKLQKTTVSKTQHIRGENEHGNDGSPGWQQWVYRISKAPNGCSFCNLNPERRTQPCSIHRAIGYRHGQQGLVRVGNDLYEQR